MRVCLRLGIVSYQDSLNAIGRAYDKHLAAQGNGGVSLINASQRRWVTGNGAVYSDGLLVAFLYDLTLRYQSKNRNSIDDLFRELMRKHGHGAKREDGNRAAIGAMNALLGSSEFTKRYVEGADAINLKESAAKYGLQVDRVGSRVRISVAEKMNKEQASLQRKLGYSY
jgi:predicted metalloprotease with PDZ domain